MPGKAAASVASWITKRFVISRTEEAEVSAFLVRLQQQSAARLSLSMLVRALVNLAMQSEEKISAEVAQYQFRSPSTLDRLAMSEFEDLWQRCLANALKRPDSPTQVRGEAWPNAHSNRIG
ncbi:MAG: hypothetical protein U1G08_04850 [Verrucomicrobiota bacterium]